jgi:hypothetical protein
MRYKFFYIRINVLAEVQGSFTFPPQQMPLASTYIQNSHLEFADEMPLLSGISQSCGWDFEDADRGIGANKVWRNFIASLMMNKRDFVAFIRFVLEVRRDNVSRINKFCFMPGNGLHHKNTI